jgi:NADP-dependent 3-hydroxy acid dehydrogenase YdfG
MKILITGNKDQGLAKSLCSIYPDAFFASRKTGFDLTTSEGQKKFAELSLGYDVIVNSSALWKFQQTVLLEQIYKRCIEANHRPYIINIGSTTDRVKNAKVWLYNAEKKALRDFSNTIGLNGVWGKAPKVTLISFGTLSNMQHKHLDRKCLDIDIAALYIKWLIEQPKDVCINEISIDPLQVINE